MTDFLPENYEVPVIFGEYLNKLPEGETTMRILSSAIIGWEGWKQAVGSKGEKIRKPVRFRMNEKPVDLRPFDKQKLNHFWAFVIWNYNANKIQIYEVTQKTIQGEIQAYTKNLRWGDPKLYDLTISRKGTTIEDTEYHVMANPPIEEITTEIENAYLEKPINLEAMFDDGDPFNKNTETIIPEDEMEIEFNKL